MLGKYFQARDIRVVRMEGRWNAPELLHSIPSRTKQSAKLLLEEMPLMLARRQVRRD